MTTVADSLRAHLLAAACDDRSLRVWGQGVVTDPKRIFGTLPSPAEMPTDHGRQPGLVETPNSEAAVLGAAVGAAMAGQRTVVVYQRVEFALLAMNAIVNQAAKVAWLSGGKLRCPLVLRMIIGRGWGQGPTHGQSFEATWAGIPGLKVVMPGRPEDMGPLLYASIMDGGPVVFLEHRWLHGLPVPDDSVCRTYKLEAGPRLVSGPAKARITIVGTGYMTVEAGRAGQVLAADGIAAEVWDMSVLMPINPGPLVASVATTGRLLFVDTGPCIYGIGSTVNSLVAQGAWRFLKAPPGAIGCSFEPLPSSPRLAADYYPTPRTIAVEALRLLGTTLTEHGEKVLGRMEEEPTDLPPKQSSFGGPF